MRMFARSVWTIVSLVVVMAPSLAFAQASIAGTVKDPSGAVLPGATVEAASPTLIEKVRTAVTDGSGQYKIENLRPGTYSRDVRPDRASARSSATASSWPDRSRPR